MLPEGEVLVKLAWPSITIITLYQVAIAYVYVWRQHTITWPRVMWLTLKKTNLVNQEKDWHSFEVVFLSAWWKLVQ